MRALLPLVPAAVVFVIALALQPASAKPAAAPCPTIAEAIGPHGDRGAAAVVVPLQSTTEILAVLLDSGMTVHGSPVRVSAGDCWAVWYSFPVGYVDG